MNDFIERIDERRRQRCLREEAAAAAAAASDQLQQQQQPLHTPGPRGGSILQSEDSGLSNASDSTAASLRAQARKLQEEALLNRDKASCVRGAQQSFRLRVAEMREKEALRLLAMADAAEDAAGGPQAEDLSPLGSEAPCPPSHRGPVGGGPSYADAASFSQASNTPRETLQRDQWEGRVSELLAAAAERRDKATCVKGGKQRALLAMAERLENEAHALAAGIRQQQGQHQQQQQQQQPQQQHYVAAAGDYHPSEVASSGRHSVGSEASYSSQQQGHTTLHQQPQHHMLHQQQQQQPPSVYGDSGASQPRSARGSEAQFYGGEQQQRMQQQQQQRMQQQHRMQQQRLPETPREEADMRDLDNSVLSGKRRAMEACVPTQADRAVLEAAERLRQEALLCRDKARCCSGAKQRQLVSLAELKERRAADMFSQVSACDSSSSQQQPQQQHIDYHAEPQQPCAQPPYTQLYQQPEDRKAAGNVRGRVNPRGDSGIFDQ